MTGALFISALVALVAVWWAAVQWRYRFEPSARPPVVEARTRDGWRLTALHRAPVGQRFDEAVILCHGLANGAAFMDFEPPASLAAFLAARGFDCFSVDLRGAGGSTPPHDAPWEASFDDYVTFDVPALVEAVRAVSGARRVWWVGHSMGGLLGLAAASGASGEHFAGLVTLGSPVYFRFHPRLLRLLALGRLLAAPSGVLATAALALSAPFAGRLPAPAFARHTSNLDNIDGAVQRRLLVNVFAPMWGGVLAQLADWVAHDVFRSADGRVDYRAGLSRLTLPVLVAGGAVDVMAPPAVCREAFGALGAADSQLAMFGREWGHAIDYGHGDLLVGRRAHEDVYPVVYDFLARRSTRRGE